MTAYLIVLGYKLRQNEFYSRLNIKNIKRSAKHVTPHTFSSTVTLTTYSSICLLEVPPGSEHTLQKMFMGFHSISPPKKTFNPTEHIFIT